MVINDRAEQTGKCFLAITDDAGEMMQTGCAEWDDMVDLGCRMRPHVEKVTLIYVGDLFFTYRDIGTDLILGPPYY